MRKGFRGAPIFTVVSLLMIVAMIVLLFTPYWQVTVKEKNEEGKRVEIAKDISISEYVWFPKDYKDLTKDYEDASGEEFVINDEVTMPAVVLVLGVALIVFSLMRISSVRGSLSALGLGGLGVYGYLSSGFLRTGYTWQTNMIVSAVTAGIGLVSTIVFLVVYIRRKQAKKVSN